MANRSIERQILAAKTEMLSDDEVTELLDYLSIKESIRLKAGAPGSPDDDLVTLLSDAQENRRARQAFEWEIVRRRAERRAGSLHR